MTELNRIPLNGLRAVEAVARCGSLPLAAAELGVTPGAVSQQVLRVERILAARLFDRQPTGMAPTALGERVAEALTAGFAKLSAAVHLATERTSDTLTLSVPPVLAARWLVSRLARFSARHPDIQVRVQAEVAMRNPDRSDIDLCLRIGGGDWPGLRAEYLFAQRVFPVCGQSVAARLESPADLARVAIIRDAGAMFGWADWLLAEGQTEEILSSGPVFSDAGLCLEAAMAGAGVFLAWESLANDPLADGRLTEPFPGRRHPTGAAYWLVTGSEGARTPPQRAFRTWLLEELAAGGLMDPL